MRYRYLDFLPKITFAMSWSGSGKTILVVARTSSEAKAFVRCEYGLSTDVPIWMWQPTPEHVYECEQHGLETIVAIP